MFKEQPLTQEEQKIESKDYGALALDSDEVLDTDFGNYNNMLPRKYALIALASEEGVL